jgi:hypothetical protein
VYTTVYQKVKEAWTLEPISEGRGSRELKPEDSESWGPTSAAYT